MKQAIALMMIVGLLAGLTGCQRQRVTRENYDRINSGMTRQEVENILGAGELQSGAGAAIGDVEGSVSTYEWREDGRTITITFVNDRVRAKSQENLG